MAEASSSTAASPRTSQQARPPTLRASCLACADAKVGCTKEKPACVRCVRRQEACVYAATRRPGRRARNRDPDAENGTTQSQSPGTKRNSGSRPQRELPSAASLPASVSPRDSALALDDAAFGTDPFLEQNELSNALLFGDLTTPMNIDATLQVDFDDFLASLSPGSTFPPPIPSAYPQSSNVDKAMGLDSFNTTHTTITPQGSERPADPMRTWYSGPRTSTASTTPNSASPSNWFSSSNSTLSTRSYQQSQQKDSLIHETSASPPLAKSATGSCGCFSRGLELLGQLSPPPTDEQAHPTLRLEFEEVVARNDRAVELTWDMLQCQYHHDDSLLLIISLIVFKILGWYSAAACSLPMDEAEIEEMGDASFGPVVLAPAENIPGYEQGERPDRIICQLVLSKIHNVQRIVKTLCQQLSTSEEQRRRARPSSARSSRTANAAHELLFGGPVFNHLTSGSASMTQDLERNLRSRLVDLSQAIVERLSG